MATAEAIYAAERHRAAQLGLRSEMLLELSTLWLSLDPYRLDETTPSWLHQVVALIVAHRRRSAELAIEFYEEYRSYELGSSPSFRGSTGLIPPREAIETSMRVLGPVGIKKRVGKGMLLEDARNTAFVEVSGAAGRHVLNGGRDATFDAIVRDEVALRWARKTGPNPCWFCAMLASRGPVYHSRFSASRKGEDAPSVRRGTGVFGEMFHDHCQCTVVPVFSMDDEWPDRGREFEAAWKELSQILGRSPTAQEWRKFYNERYGHSD